MRRKAITEKLVDVLKQDGPISARELAAVLGISINFVTSTLGRLRDSKSRQAYIHSYRRDSDGGRLYPRALWAFGDRPDAKRPGRLTATQYNRRYRQRKRTAVSSVWQLATPVDARRVGRKTT